MQRLLGGLISGLCATAPMTLAMIAVHRMLPPDEQYALPPYKVTMEAGEKAGVEDALDDEEARIGATLISHFAFGAGAGAFYPLFRTVAPLDAMPSGVAHGLVVWGANYLGLLPAAGLYRSPQREPLGRHAMMIAAHVVWGAALGLLYKNLVMEGQPPVPVRGERVSY